MKAETTKEYQTKLNNLILELSKHPLNADEVKSNALSLKDIYVEDFRHLYSDFFPIVTTVIKDNDYDSEYLLSNLRLIMEYTESDYEKNESQFKDYQLKGIRKLHDHINLEVARLNFAISTPDLKEAKEQLEQSREELTEARKSIVEAKVKLDSSHGQVVSVLSIFAAIVLAFAGGIGILGSSINAVVEAPIFKLLMVIFSVGLVLIDAITALMFAVSKIVGKSIFVKCKEEHCTCQKNGKATCNGLTKIRKRLPFVFWVNVVLIVLSAITVGLAITNHYFCFI